MTYEVNEKTLVIIPISDRRCKVLEKDRNYNINNTSLKIIEHSCEYFGVSYKARLQGSYSFIKSRYKVPIIIEEATGMVFFPITSQYKSNNNFWLSYSNIKEYYPCKTKKQVTVIRFINGFKMEIPVSFYSFNNQFLKASRLSSVLSDRMLRKC